MVILDRPHILDLVGEVMKDNVGGLSETGVEFLLIREEGSHLFYGIQIRPSKNFVEESNQSFLQGGVC